MPPLTPKGIAVLHSDHTTTSLSLLNENAQIVFDDCLHSGSMDAKLTQAISGNVALPSQIQIVGGDLILVDRTLGVLTYVDRATCAVTKQIKVNTNFKANPQDVLTLSPNKAYVTRYNQNDAATPAAEDLDDGNDILVFDPSSQALIKRIDLRPFAGAAPGDGILPRGDRMLSIGGLVYVSLNNLDVNFKKSGPGRVLVIDPASDAVTGQIELPGLENCGALATDGSSLFVSCLGLLAAGPGVTDLSSGVARVTLPTREVRVLGSTVFGGGVVSAFSLAVLDRDRIAALTLGDFNAQTPDRLWVANATTSTAAQAFQGSGPFSLQAVLADKMMNRYWLTDAGSEPRLRSFNVDAAGAVTAAEVLQTSLTRKLPPSAIAWY